VAAAASLARSRDTGELWRIEKYDWGYSLSVIWVFVFWFQMLLIMTRVLVSTTDFEHIAYIVDEMVM